MIMTTEYQIELSVPVTKSALRREGARYGAPVADRRRVDRRLAAVAGCNAAYAVAVCQGSAFAICSTACDNHQFAVRGRAHAGVAG
jgi:hypothetical protein